MALVGGSLPIGATFAPTGGTARSLISLGGDRSGVELLVDDGAAYAVRTTINVATTRPQARATSPGGYTGAKRTVTAYQPKLLADGSYFVNQAGQFLIVHPETTDAEIDALLSLQGNFADDTDFTSYWKTGSHS
jgi:hypothetical protein